MCHRITELVVIAGNLNAVCYREDILLPHDNATSHTACSVHDFLQDRNVSVLPWLEKSLDLAGALVEEWGNISQQEWANLVQSMRRRCYFTAVLNSAGGHTRY